MAAAYQTFVLKAEKPNIHSIQNGWKSNGNDWKGVKRSFRLTMAKWIELQMELISMHAVCHSLEFIII